MKKFLLAFSLLGVCGFGVCANKQVVLAEELEPEIVEVIDTTEPEPEIVEEISQDDFEKFKQEITEYLSQFADESLVVRIMTWLFDAGILTALFTVVLKYRKYKHTTVEDLIVQFKGNIKDYMEENFNKLGAGEVKKITDSIQDLECATDTIMKVLVLMQDNTAKGKAALLEYLAGKTTNKEIVEATVQVNEKLEAEQAKEQEIKAKVKDDYKEIF